MNEVAMYTPRQVADVLMMSRSGVYDLIGKGIIPSVKIGRCRRIPRVAFHAYVEKLTQHLATGSLTHSRWINDDGQWSPV